MQNITIIFDKIAKYCARQFTLVSKNYLTLSQRKQNQPTVCVLCLFFVLVV